MGDGELDITVDEAIRRLEKLDCPSCAVMVPIEVIYQTCKMNDGKNCEELQRVVSNDITIGEFINRVKEEFCCETLETIESAESELKKAMRGEFNG